MSVLAKIVASKEREIAELRRRPWPEPRKRTPLDVPGALRAPGQLALIAEVKRRSPSAGPLSTVLGVAERVRAYAGAGASMISVLCDAPFFDGSFGHLALARDTLDAAGRSVPLLAKEFVLDEVQIACAAAAGADAVLLIARLVSPSRLRELAAAARDASLEPFTEVVDETELDAALAAGATVIGVNARDLDTLTMDAERAKRVLAAIPDDRVAAHLSGLRAPDDVRRIRQGRANAALIGETLMREDDPAPLLARLVTAARE